MNDLSDTFGHETVAPAQREQRIRQLFDTVAPRYDLLNDLLSLGIHRRWKNQLVRLADPQPGQFIVDLAGGTGDVARRLAGPGRHVTVVDPSQAMMAVGRRRADRGVHWMLGAAESIPLPTACVDTVTMAFGLRNTARVPVALAEVLRVLKPGGRFLCLEFSTPVTPLRPLYHLFSQALIPRLGSWIGGSSEAYRYLVESIRRFPDQARLAQAMTEAGFQQAHWHNLSGGIAAIHVGQRDGRLT